MLKCCSLFSVPFAYQRYGHISVSADSPEEAAAIAGEKLGEMSLAEMEDRSDYLCESEEIDAEAIVEQIRS